MMGLRRLGRPRLGAVVAMGLLATAVVGRSGPASAANEAVEAFYKGRTVEMFVGTPASGGYDMYARLIAQHIGKHIPGNPNVIVRNMPGAAHMTMTNHVFNAAPRDGSVIAIPQQVMAIDQAMGAAQGIRYDAAKFNWIGRVLIVTTVNLTWHTSPTKTIEDAKKRETVVGTTGASSPTNLYHKALNDLVGTKFKRISGYAGTADAELALQRGEVEGVLADWNGFKVRNPEWLRDKKVNILVQWGVEVSSDLPGVPLAGDLGATDEQKQVLRFLALGNAIGRAFVTTPEVPTDRLATLRAAFLATMQDPELIDSARKQNIDIGPVASGEQVQKLIAETLGYSPSVIALAKKVWGEN